MKQIQFPYGKSRITYSFEENSLAGILTSAIGEYVPKYNPGELVKIALENPIGSRRLSELAHGKENIVIIASDHTRPVPSKVIIPAMLEEIRSTSPHSHRHGLPSRNDKAGTN